MNLQEQRDKNLKNNYYRYIHTPICKSKSNNIN